MTTTTTVGVFGVKEALKELREIDPELRKAINKRAKELQEDFSFARVNSDSEIPSAKAQ